MSRERPTPTPEVHITVLKSPVLVPYAEFLERRDRRCRAASAVGRQGAASTIDAEPVAVAVVKPIGHDRKYPCRVKNAEA
jgi:hypothetical protein